MNRVSYQKTENISINELTSNSAIFDCQDLDNIYSLDIRKDIRNVVYLNLKKNSKYTFNFSKDSRATISFLSADEIENSELIFNISDNSEIYIYFADFLINKNSIKVEINMNGQFSNVKWHLASLSSSKDNKCFDVSVYHNVPNTFAISDNFGVCKDDSKLVFSGISHIKNGSIKSKTSQNAKIMVFDPLSNGVAKPILKIDENDIEANHAAIVGKISDEHLFYLQSRGLSEAQAKELITLGYLKPILEGFNSEHMKEQIMEIISRRM